MFVVMALLLIVTATGTLAIHSTSIELRGVGNARRAMQTRYLAEGGLSTMLSVSEINAAELETSLAMSRTGSVERDLSPNEPRMAPDKGLSRWTLGFLASHRDARGHPVAADSLGRGMGYEPDLVVDVNDDHESSSTIPGEASGAPRAQRYGEVTTTSRARTQLVGRVDAYSPTQSVTGVPTADAWRPRGFHETTSDARATALIVLPGRQ